MRALKLLILIPLLLIGLPICILCDATKGIGHWSGELVARVLVAVARWADVDVDDVEIKSGEI